MFHELPPNVRRIIFAECARVLKPGGRLLLVDSLQSGDQPDYEGLFDLFPQNYHEPYYASYASEDFGAIAKACGLIHIRDVKAFVSKVMVFDKPVEGVGRRRQRPNDLGNTPGKKSNRQERQAAHRKLRSKML